MSDEAGLPSAKDNDAFVDELLNWIQALGTWRYDEEVTQLEHALQCAHLARENGDDDGTVAAALLHDVGHLLTIKHRKLGKNGTEDLRHEHIGANWLKRRFPHQVTEAVRLHVPAKRYLCHIEPEYWDGLSDGSKRSLELQGGPMTASETKRFETLPGAAEAVQVRRYDDLAKVVGKPVPALPAYRTLLLGLLRR